MNHHGPGQSDVHNTRETKVLVANKFFPGDEPPEAATPRHTVLWVNLRVEMISQGKLSKLDWILPRAL